MKSPQRILRAMPVEDLSVTGDGRTVVLRLLSFGTDYTVTDDGVTTYIERWSPKAFRRSWAAGADQRVPLAYEHTQPGLPRALPVGRSRRGWTDGDALMLEGRISRTTTGDDLLELLRDEVVTGVSIDARAYQSRAIPGGYERLEAALTEVAFTTRAQLPDAGLLALRSEPEPDPGTPRLDTLRQKVETLFS